MAVDLKLITLNCWGLPFPVLCKNRIERIRAIGDFIKSSDFDIVILEEIWVKSDFHMLRDKLMKKLPFSHYFYSGTIGSGICVYSKHLIMETMYHRFHLNGHAHKIFHGDWFGGKGVGLCQIHADGMDVNLYCTHFHAEYNPGQDEYEAHRLAQAFEMSQFIRATSSNCDLILLAGDLNTCPSNLGYRLIRQHTGLKDTWAEWTRSKGITDRGGTCDVPGNCYSDPKTVKRSPYGDRIDYIMFQTKDNYLASVSHCQTGMGKIPHLDINYSDHEAVITTLSIAKLGDAHSRTHIPLTKDLKESLQESLLVLDKGVTQCLSEEKFFQLLVLALSIVLYGLNSYVSPSSYTSGNNLLFVAFTFSTTKLMLAIGIGFAVWTALIVKRAEFHGLISCKEDMMKLLGV